MATHTLNNSTLADATMNTSYGSFSSSSSGASFASFGGSSSSSLNEDSSISNFLKADEKHKGESLVIADDITDDSAARPFVDQPIIDPTAPLQSRNPFLNVESQLVKAASLRFTSLQLIEEDDGDE
jgi:hypothetical protein